MPISFFRLRAHLKKRIKPWKVNLFGSQDFSPTSFRISKRMGIKKGEKVLVFAGYFGDWAKYLMPLAKITFTDLSRDYTERFSRTVSGAKTKTIPAEIIPVRAKKYNWSFSFEPFPLVEQGGLTYALSRSMLNKNGSKIVFSNQNLARNDLLKRVSQKVAKIYDAEFVLSNFSVDVISAMDTLRKKQGSDSENIVFQRAAPTKKQMNLITIKTNPLSRRKAFVDNLLLNIIDKEMKKEFKNNYSRSKTKSGLRPTKKTTQKDYDFALTLVPLLSKKLNLSEQEVKQSIERLKQLSMVYLSA